MNQPDTTDFSGGWPKGRLQGMGLAFSGLVFWPLGKTHLAASTHLGQGDSVSARKRSIVVLGLVMACLLSTASFVLAQDAICGNSADCNTENEGTGEGGNGGRGGNPEARSGNIAAGDARGGDASLGGGGNGGNGGGGGAAGGSGPYAGATIGGRGGGGDGGPGGAGSWSCVSIGGAARSGDNVADNSSRATGGSSTLPVNANIGVIAIPIQRNENAGDARARGGDSTEQGPGDNNAGRNENIPIGGNGDGCSAIAGNATGGSNRNVRSNAVINRSGNGARGGNSGNSNTCGTGCFSRQEEVRVRENDNQNNSQPAPGASAQQTQVQSQQTDGSASSSTSNSTQTEAQQNADVRRDEARERVPTH